MFTRTLGARKFATLGAATLALATVAAANGMPARGVDGFGKTNAFVDGKVATVRYFKGFYCDATVAAKSISGCELGAPANRAPAAHYGVEYGLVPIGFDVPAMQMNCPAHLVCVDHPGTLDMTRAAKPLAAALKTTPDKIMPALANAAVPGHNHILTTMNDGKPEWWAIKIIGITSPKTYKAILAHRTYAYVQSLIAAGDPSVLKPAPTNLFLYFAVAPTSDGDTM